MSVTRRGFLGIGAAVFGSALLPGKDPVPVVPDDVIVLDSLSGVLADLEKNGLRNPPREWHKLGEVFAEEIQATMARPGFTDRILQQHCTPVAKEELLRSGEVGALADFQITEVHVVEDGWVTTTFHVKDV